MQRFFRYLCVVLASACGVHGDEANAKLSALDADPDDEVADCYSSLSSNHPATLEFWRAFHAGDYAARSKVIAGLADAAKTYPNEEEFALLNGLSNLWLAAERQNLDDSLAALDGMKIIIDELTRAYKLCPTDHRILAWLGPSEIVLGQFQLDNNLVAHGEQVLEQGLKRFHFFATFANIILYTDLPASDPKFARALDAATYFFDNGVADCAAHPTDACVNTPAVPHNLEGLPIYLGDVFARAQNRERALQAYELSKRGPAWSTWKYRDLLETRIQTLDQRMQAAANGFTLDDMESASTSTAQCSYCHRE